MNRVEIIGNLTAEPNVTMVASGDKKATFTLAVKGYGDDTYFFPVEAWKKTAEIIQKYVHKGDRVGIAGKLTSRKYEDKNGDRRTVIEIRADEIDLLAAKEKQSEPEKPHNTQSIDEEDLPF